MRSSGLSSEVQLPLYAEIHHKMQQLVKLPSHDTATFSPFMQLETSKCQVRGSHFHCSRIWSYSSPLLVEFCSIGTSGRDRCSSALGRRNIHCNDVLFQLELADDTDTVRAARTRVMWSSLAVVLHCWSDASDVHNLPRCFIATHGVARAATPLFQLSPLTIRGRGLSKTATQQTWSCALLVSNTRLLDFSGHIAGLTLHFLKCQLCWCRVTVNFAV